MQSAEASTVPRVVVRASRRILLLALAVFACAASPALANWSAPKPAPAGIGWPNLSCPTTSYCLALTGGAGLEMESLTWNGSSWSSPVPLDLNFVPSVSCPTATLCVAVDEAGNAVYYRGGAWSAPVPVAGSSSLWDVSCPSATFCAATEDINPVIALGSTAPDAVYFFNGTSWMMATTLPATDYSLEISCTSDRFCMAIDGAGDAYAYRAGHWSSPMATVKGATDPGGLSCTSPRFCAILGASQATTWNGTAWTAPVTWAASGDNAVEISCASADLCMAPNTVESGINPAEFSTNVLSFNGRQWVNQALPGGYDTLGVSCPTSTFCIMTQFRWDTQLDYYRTWSPDHRAARAHADQRAVRAHAKRSRGARGGLRRRA